MIARLVAAAMAGVIAIGLAATTTAVAQEAERILRYDVEVSIHADGALDVTEHITVHAAERRIRRGIYRDFPTRYRDRYGNNVIVDFEVLGVERDGEPEAWFTERRGNGVRVNTGGDDYLPRLPGEYRFTLRYRTHRQIGFFETHDELYWNAIGTGWAFPIDAAGVEVRLPEPVPADQLEAEGYTGPQGAQGQNYRAQITAPGVARWQLTSPLAPGEGLTIVLSFPKGLVTAPTRAERGANLLADNRGVLVALAGFLALLAFTVRRWHRVGRDPEVGVIIPRYEAPAGRTPAELRYLRRGRYDIRCFTSDLLHAAVQGGVTVEQEPRVLLSNRWRLQRAAATATPAASTAGAASTSAAPWATSASASAASTPADNPARTLIEHLFAKGSTVELKKSSAPVLQGALRAHARALVRRLQGSHFRRNIGSTVTAVVLAVATLALALIVSGGGGVPLILVVGFAMALVVIAFGWLVQAPTPEGRRLLDESAGLRVYLQVAERDELAGLEGPQGEPPLDAARYEALLPYAVALDVEEAWTRKFTLAVGAAAAAAATARIVWYQGGGVNQLGSLAQHVGSGLDRSIASASTPPGSSSGRSGGGSFGRGGGFSGGGGGGGGGGGR